MPLMPQSTRLSISRAVGAVDPVAPQRPQQRPHRRSLRSPELHRRPEPESLKRNRRRRRRRAQAARAGRAASRRRRLNAPRRILRDHSPRDKQHHLASRKCRRESTPETPRPPELQRPPRPDFVKWYRRRRRCRPHHLPPRRLAPVEQVRRHRPARPRARVSTTRKVNAVGAFRHLTRLAQEVVPGLSETLGKHP